VNSTASDLEVAVAILGKRGVISPVDALRIIHAARTSDQTIASLLLDAVADFTLFEALAAGLDIPYIDLYASRTPYRLDDELILRADPNQMMARNALPVMGPDNKIFVAMLNPLSDQDTVDYLHSVFPEGFTPALSLHAQIQSRLVYFEAPSTDEPEPEPEPDLTSQMIAQTSPVVDWVEQLLARAATEGASDVHLQSQADGGLLVRFRIDGVFRRQAMPLRRRESEVIGVLLSRCPTIDPSDKTRPQDGTFSFNAAGRRLDARLAMLPQLHGPTVVVRILDPRNVKRRLDDMGLSTKALTVMRRCVSQSQGLILCVGPTGSGKTTTLYGLINELDAEALHILTAEDPVEYRIPYIGQTQIRSDLGEKSLTFARALRAFLRMDPDVILVGEIRDEETAEVAMHAAMTGHLVLSTIHANSSLGVFQRLEELGGEPFMVAESLSLTMSQRLIRRVHDCGTMEAPNAGEAAFVKRLGLPVPPEVMHPREGGCPGCGGSGYRGRIPVLEYMEMTPDLRSLIATGANTGEIVEAAKLAGWEPITHDAFRHVVTGDSTIAEMLRCLDTGVTS